MLNDISDEEKKEIASLITKASQDIDEFYCKIKKSKKILKYKNRGHLLTEIYSYIIANFSLLQILEFSGKAKMIHDESGTELNRKQRFNLCSDMFKSKFEHVFQQHLQIMDLQDEK